MFPKPLHLSPIEYLGLHLGFREDMEADVIEGAYCRVATLQHSNPRVNFCVIFSDRILRTIGRDSWHRVRPGAHAASATKPGSKS